MDHGRLASTGGPDDDGMTLSSHVSSLSERREHRDGD